MYIYINTLLVAMDTQSLFVKHICNTQYKHSTTSYSGVHIHIVHYTCSTVLEGQKLKDAVKDADSHRQTQQIGVGLQQGLLYVCVCVWSNLWKFPGVSPFYFQE